MYIILENIPEFKFQFPQISNNSRKKQESFSFLCYRGRSMKEEKLLYFMTMIIQMKNHMYTI